MPQYVNVRDERGHAVRMPMRGTSTAGDVRAAIEAGWRHGHATPPPGSGQEEAWSKARAPQICVVRLIDQYRQRSIVRSTSLTVRPSTIDRGEAAMSPVRAWGYLLTSTMERPNEHATPLSREHPSPGVGPESSPVWRSAEGMMGFPGAPCRAPPRVVRGAGDVQDARAWNRECPPLPLTDPDGVPWRKCPPRRGGSTWSSTTSRSLSAPS